MTHLRRKNRGGGGGGGVGELFFHLLARGEGELEKCTSFGFSSCPCPINNEQFLSIKSFLGFVSCLFVVFGVECLFVGYQMACVLHCGDVKH